MLRAMKIENFSKLSSQITFINSYKLTQHNYVLLLKYLQDDKNNTFDVRRTLWSDLIVKHVAPIPYEYLFQVQVLDGNETSVPVVSKFILNNVTLCSNEIKVNYKYFYPYACFPEGPLSLWSQIHVNINVTTGELITVIAFTS